MTLVKNKLTVKWLYLEAGIKLQYSNYLDILEIVAPQGFPMHVRAKIFFPLFFFF